MRATEMHDLLAKCLAHIKVEGIFYPGDAPEFRHIRYCHFCRFSEDWTAVHGHAESCLYDRLERACSPNSIGGEQK